MDYQKIHSISVQGGKKLKGSINPQGAKNEALMILCAVLLTKDEVIINNIPDLIDTRELIDLLEGLGVNIQKSRNGTYRFVSKDIDIKYLEFKEFKEKSSRIRGSVMIMGPLLSRFGAVKIPRPGGDKIGRRKLDTHFEAFEKLGARFWYDDKSKFFHLEGNSLKGSNFTLTEASVTGTANIIMAAVFANGKTEIYNAACEPYIQQLCKMLNKMGARITGVGSNKLSIQGVMVLNGTNHTILPDMIEIGSWIGLAALTDSWIQIKNVSIENLGIIPDTFKKLGINFELKGDDIIVSNNKSYDIKSSLDGSIQNIADAPWPGLTPDLLSILLVTSIRANGEILIHQKMFESRLFFVDKIIEMGGKVILCDPHRVIVIGSNGENILRGNRIASPDIRAGMALLIAALSAEGTSTIENYFQIQRGYENLVEKLQNLGAEIKINTI